MARRWRPHHRGVHGEGGALDWPAVRQGTQGRYSVMDTKRWAAFREIAPRPRELCLFLLWLC